MKFLKKVEDDFVLNRGSMSVNNEISLAKLKFNRKNKNQYSKKIVVKLRNEKKNIVYPWVHRNARQ